MTFADDGYVVFNPHIPCGLIEAVVQLAWDADASNGHLPLHVRKSGPVLAIARHIVKSDGFAAVMSQPCYMHMPPMVRRVDPFDTAAAVPLHQDLAYNRHIDGPFVTVWLTLVPIDAECGGLLVYPGTHNQGELPRQGDGKDWLGSVILKDAEIVRMRVIQPLCAGTAVLLTSDVVHGSVPNMSARPRFSIDYRFFKKAGASSKPCMEM